MRMENLSAIILNIFSIKSLISHIPQGDVYRDMLTTYFIPGPTMMIRREVFAALGGYDESLSYEDFDFWVRSSRIYRYAFLNERLTSIRKLKSSMSTGWYVPGDQTASFDISHLQKSAAAQP